MSEKNITFEDLPKAMSWLMDKLNELDSKIDGLNNQNQSVPTEQWMNLKELCDYIPSHPAEQTVYGWTSCHLIPFHKRGKRIMFLKSEIDEWLHAGKIKYDIGSIPTRELFHRIYDGFSFGGSVNRYRQRCQYSYSWWMD